MKAVRFLFVLVIGDVSVGNISPDGQRELLGEAGEAVSAVLEATSQPRCSVILLTDGTTQPYTIIKLVGKITPSWGVGVFQVTADGQEANVTHAMTSRVVSEAWRLRQLSWCVTVVVVSDDPAFLAAFALWSLKGRLLLWSTRLLVLTRLPLQQLQILLANHWTFSMMNTIFMIYRRTSSSIKCVVYCHLPYGPRGAETVRVASWTPARGLTTSPHRTFFPQKFNNFHGETVSVTGLPWPPFFIEYEERTSDGISVKNYKGPDGLLFRTIANALNFTFEFLPSSDWIDAADKVVERKSLMLVVSHVLLYTRSQRYDYTYVYTDIPSGFGLAKPLLKPQWQSLYYPLADEVWASTLAVLLLMPGIMYMVNLNNKWLSEGDGVGEVNTRNYSFFSRDIGAIIQEILGTLLGQNLSRRMPGGSSSRLLMGTWLVFAFIIGTVYRGNLTAALTLPKYPPRPETVEELVNYVDRVTIPPYGEEWQKQFRESGSSALESLAELMHIGPTILQGLQEALTKKQAHLCARQDFEYWVAGRLTRSDGSNPLYFGRENLIPGASAWPVPHDAPYKPQLDTVMMIVKEAGLYEKWTEDTLDETRLENRAKDREQRQEKGWVETHAATSLSKALTIVHMQGPLILLLLGFIISGLAFTIELLKLPGCP